MGEIIPTLLRFIPSVGLIVLLVIAMGIAHRIVLARTSGGLRSFQYQIIMVGITGVGLFLLILVLPIGDAMRGQLLQLIGIVLSAAIALSSTTFLGNAMGGVMLRATKSFRVGDFLRTEHLFGRVSETGLFHTEIQTEDRDITVLPNLYLVTNPFTRVLSSGTIISAEVSLGYDVSRKRIEKTLLEAALSAGLEDPFTHVRELGDYSVTYRVAGMLKDVKRLISARSDLRDCMIDQLHEAGIEIVSPTFMNQRIFPHDKPFIPKRSREDDEFVETQAESVVFDKAEEAESIEGLREHVKDLDEKIAELEKKGKGELSDAARDALASEIEDRKKEREKLRGTIQLREKELDERRD